MVEETLLCSPVTETENTDTHKHGVKLPMSLTAEVVAKTSWNWAFVEATGCTAETGKESPETFTCSSGGAMEVSEISKDDHKSAAVIKGDSSD